MGDPSLKQISIKQIVENDLGVWVATKNGLKLVPHLSEKSVDISIDGYSDKRISGVWQLPENQLLVISEKKLFIYRNNEFVSFSSETDAPIITHLPFDDDGAIYAYGAGQLYKVDLNSSSFESLNIKLPKTKVISLAGWDDSLWLGTIGQGLYGIDLISKTVKQYNKEVGRNNSLSDDIITALYFDESKNFWLGNFNNGADYTAAVGNNNFVHDYSNNLYECIAGSAVHAFYSQGKNILLGTSSGAYFYQPQLDKCDAVLLEQEIDSVAGNKEVWSIISDANDIYLTIGASVAKFNQNSNSLQKLFELKDVPYIYSLKKDINDFLAATAQGVFFISQNGEVKRQILDGIRVFKIVTPANGDTYFLLNKAVYRLSKAGELKEIFLSQEEDINDIAITDSDIWLAMNSSRVLQLDISGNKAKEYRVADEGSSLSIASIILNEDSLWMGTNKGIIQYQLASDKSKHFYQTEGVSEKAFVRRAIYAGLDGKLYLGSRDGFNAFYPANIKDNLVTPKVVLTKFNRFNEEAVLCSCDT